LVTFESSIALSIGFVGLANYYGFLGGGFRIRGSGGALLADSDARLRFDPLALPALDPSEPGAIERLACLDYGLWMPADAGKAAKLLDEQPDLGRCDVFAASAAGDVEAARGMLDRSPGLARERGGPFGWEALLYACYSRLPDRPGRSTLEVARLLLEHGADPDAGFLWQGNFPPFTALTGAFGEGEGGASQPAHPRRDALARLLLEAGADPNDGQTLYNRHFRSDDGHLTLLFEFGLGADRGGPWYRHFGDRLMSPARLLSEELWCAARRGFAGRARLLLDHGADPNAPGLRDGRTPWEAATLSGNVEIAELLLARGARRSSLDPSDAFAAACVAGRSDEAKAALARDPDLKERLGRDGRIRLVHRAVEADHPEGVRLMAELGFELDQWTRHDGAGINLYTTPLHNAAWMGSLAMVKLLLDLGVDPGIRDPTFDGTPLGWAEYNGQTEVATYLERKLSQPL
jgi:ankyrin repeat protein